MRNFIRRWHEARRVAGWIREYERSYANRLLITVIRDSNDRLSASAALRMSGWDSPPEFSNESYPLDVEVFNRDV